MEIHGDYRPIDPLTRKRQAAAAAAHPAAQPEESAEARGDEARVEPPSAETIARYVQVLKTMNPVDLHRVEELRARIKDGSYRAEPGEMAGVLSDLFARDPRRV
jgi:flagellar biosynthesis anti-sigma factor FlgM